MCAGLGLSTRNLQKQRPDHHALPFFPQSPHARIPLTLQSHVLHYTFADTIPTSYSSPLSILIVLPSPPAHISSSHSPLPFLHHHHSTPLPRLAPSTIYPLSFSSTNKIITLHSLHHPPFPSTLTPLSSIPLQHCSPPLPPYFPSPLPSLHPSPILYSSFSHHHLPSSAMSLVKDTALWASNVPFVVWCKTYFKQPLEILDEGRLHWASLICDPLPINQPLAAFCRN